MTLRNDTLRKLNEEIDRLTLLRDALAGTVTLVSAPAKATQAATSRARAPIGSLLKTNAPKAPKAPRGRKAAAATPAAPAESAPTNGTRTRATRAPGGSASALVLSALGTRGQTTDQIVEKVHAKRPDLAEATIKVTISKLKAAGSAMRDGGMWVAAV